MIKLFRPFIAPGVTRNVERILDSGNLAEGEEVKLFEQELEKALDKKNIVALNSGTSALELAYELADIQEGDEVITTVFTCTATNLPLVRRKAKIIFADIDSDLNINTEDVENKITDRTKCIVFVHFGGNNRGLTKLLSICKARDIILVEDAAQAIGSDYWGKADFTAVSLQAIKILTCGDGGLLICKHTQDYKRAKRLRWFGIDREEKQRGGNPDVTEAGFKYHMNNISAAIGRGNLEYLPELIFHRKALGKIFESYGLFSHIWLTGGLTKNYKGLEEEMHRAGYEIGRHHYRNDMYTVFGGRVKDCPIMDQLEKKYFFVPSHFGVTVEDAHIIGKICKKYI